MSNYKDKSIHFPLKQQKRYSKNSYTRSDSKTRLSMLFYGFLENSLRISRETKSLLEIFRESFRKD
ncbi:MAG: hypothetical protein HN931_08025 [Desulfobacterales bacterium]|nr:hypothetical protein [Desulfobacterales bacterium]